MTNSVLRYHAGSILLHWLVALFLIANLVLGLLLDEFKGPDKFTAFQLHKSLGITVLLLSVLRLVWRLVNKAPPDLASMASWERIVAKITHVLFYALMIGIPFTGWMIVSASPFNLPTVLFGVIPWPHLPFLQGFENQKALAHQIGDVHELLAYAFIVLFFLHIGAALRHHFMIKDEVVLRMTPSWMAGFLQFLRGEKN
jgi:cytochrome b561